MRYSDTQLFDILEKLISLPKELERFEFKGNDTDKIGQYFSALSNEANLKGEDNGRLVFGVDDKTHNLIGTNYRLGIKNNLDDVKRDVANQCDITFTEIYEIIYQEKRIIMFQIPAAIKGFPTKCNGHMYGRDGEHLGALHDDEIEYIKSQSRSIDWTGETIPELSIADIDIDAINLAKEGYIQKHNGLESVIRGRDTQTFLTKIYAIRDGCITKAGALLFGKSESIVPLFHWLEISWILKDDKGENIGHEHFKPPFVLTASKAIAKIRILTQRFLPDHSLMPVDILSYDEWVLRELLANAICHQDYTRQGRTVIQEFPNYLIISNAGSFYSGSIQKVIEQKDFMPLSYRNPCLKDIMSEIRMIEYAGSGLKRIFNKQTQRYMPLPEDQSNESEVKIRLEGKIIDERYSKLLYFNKDLDVSDIINLDKIQKGNDIPDGIAKTMKGRKLIEGRKPHYYISFDVAKKTDQIGKYLDKKGPELEHQKERILSFVKSFGGKGASKKEIIDFMNNKIENSLSSKEKYNRVTNLIQELRRDNKIKPNSKGAHAKWSNI